MIHGGQAGFVSVWHIHGVYEVKMRLEMMYT